MQRESFLVLFQLLRSLEQIFAPPMIAFLENTIQTFFPTGQVEEKYSSMPPSWKRSQ